MWSHVITPENRTWVEEGYAWLNGLTSAMPPKHTWILFDAVHFPKALADPEALGPLIDDLCALLSIDRTIVSARYVSDSPDLPQMPFQMSGLSVGSDLSAEAVDDLRLHSVLLSERLRSYRQLVVHESILRLTDILAQHAGHELPDEGEGRRQWAELAAIRYGFAPILARGRNASVFKIEGDWRRTMTHRSPLPSSVFAFSVLHHIRACNINDELHMKDLPSEIRHDLKLAEEQWPAGVPHEPLAADRAFERYQAELPFMTTYEEVIRVSKDVLRDTEDRTEQAIITNEIGYALSFLGRHAEAEGWFKESMALDPDWAYPIDNLGFALIVQGDLEQGVSFVRAAMKAFKPNVQGYTARNLAVYHWLHGDLDAARSHFAMAFEESAPVDLLNALFAQFLRSHGENDEAEAYEEISEEELGGPPPAWVLTLGT